MAEKLETLDRVASQTGISNLSSTDWVKVDSENPGHWARRSLKYYLSRQSTSSFASCVTAVQQKWRSSDSMEGRLEEIITLHDVPFGDHFRVSFPLKLSFLAENLGGNTVKIA